MNTKDLSYNHRLAFSNIKTIVKGNVTYLRYKDKTIRRPAARSVVEVVKREFDLDI